jgi:putative DNA primase/helicase
MNATATPKDARGILLEHGPEALRAAVLDVEAVDTEAPAIANDSTPAKPVAPALLDYPDSDAGNAERFHAMHGRDVRHVAESGQWLLWNGHRWQPDTDGAIVRAFIATMRTMAKQAVALPDPQAAQSKAGFSLRSTNLEKVRCGLELAKSIQGVTVAVSELDADPWLVGTPDGALDLRTGQPITPERRQLLTKSIGARFDAGTGCPLWLAFLDTVTGGDAELSAYLQAAVGYTLTGLCREQCLFFLHGNGQNGKGVFSETIKALIGDYGQTAPESLFTRDRNSNATNDVARLAGCRLAIAAELDEGSAFAEARIKALTGADTITARFLHREFFDFVPSHKFWISGNHKPTVRGTDTGIWRRLRLIPFTVRIPDEKKDTALAGKLLAELPGILNWALAGCLEWQRRGLVAPECVRRATEDYRREEDVIGQFLDDCTEPEAGARTPTVSVYQAYERWAEREGIQPKFRLSARRLIRRIEEHGHARSKSNGTPVWHTLTLSDGQSGEDGELLE